MSLISDLMDFDLGRDGISTGGFYNQLGRTISSSTGGSSSLGGSAGGSDSTSVGFSFLEDAFDFADDWVSPVFDWSYGFFSWVPTWVVNSVRVTSGSMACLVTSCWYPNLWLVAIAGIMGSFLFQILDAAIRMPLMLLVASIWCAWQVCVVFPIMLILATLVVAWEISKVMLMLTAIGCVIWCVAEISPHIF